MRFKFFLSMLAVGIQACSNQVHDTGSINQLTKKVDSLNRFIQKMKPGLGELMSGIQLHHEKLWFAGTNSNWKLADFELGEIKETLEQAKEIEMDRPETKDLAMLSNPIEALNQDIKNKDLAAFKTDYSSLTNTCNTCHSANHFEFNILKIPAIPPVSDQEFAPRQEK